MLLLRNHTIIYWKMGEQLIGKDMNFGTIGSVIKKLQPLENLKLQLGQLKIW